MERNTVGSVVFHIVLLNFSKGCYKIHIFFRQILEDDPKQYLSIKSPNNDNSFLFDHYQLALLRRGVTKEEFLLTISIHFLLKQT